jgi:hypothetical protein
MAWCAIVLDGVGISPHDRNDCQKRSVDQKDQTELGMIFFLLAVVLPSKYVESLHFTHSIERA